MEVMFARNLNAFDFINAKSGQSVKDIENGNYFAVVGFGVIKAPNSNGDVVQSFILKLEDGDYVTGISASCIDCLDMFNAALIDMDKEEYQSGPWNCQIVKGKSKSDRDFFQLRFSAL